VGVLPASAPVLEYRSLYHGPRLLSTVAAVAGSIALVGGLVWGRDAFFGLFFGSVWAVLVVAILGRSATVVTSDGVAKQPRIRRRRFLPWADIEAFSERFRKTRHGPALAGVGATLARGDSHGVALEDGFQDEATVVAALNAELARHRGGAGGAPAVAGRVSHRMQLSPRAAAVHAAAFLAIAVALGAVGLALGADQAQLASDGVVRQATVLDMGTKTYSRYGESCPFTYQFVDPQSGTAYTTDANDCDTYDEIEPGETISVYVSASRPDINQVDPPDPAVAFFTAATFWWLLAVPGVGRLVAFTRARRWQAGAAEAAEPSDLVTRLVR
jgi:hypothetical protein